MAKPDPALLDLARYPFSCTIEPRFSDLDINMHINNVAMAGMLEDARMRFHTANGYREVLTTNAAMVASVSIEYLGEVSYPQSIRIACALERIGRTSHQILQVVSQGGPALVLARTVVVTVGADGPAPLPDTFLTGSQPWMLAA